MLLLLLAFACSQAPVDCPACPELAAPTPAAQAASLEDWEAQLLAPTLEELRAGIRTWGEQPFGVCEGKRDCETYMGPTPEPLVPGNFFIRAEVKVPQVGDEWQVGFAVTCSTTDARGHTSTQEHEKTYVVKYTGKERAYRLQPLWKIQSPHPSGSRSCDFSLTPLRPDGVAGEPIKGHYETPAAES